MAIDTSGSVGARELQVFGSALAGICTHTAPSKVVLLWWGSEVVGVQEFEPGDYDKLSSLMQPKDGGGTDIACVFDYVAAMRAKPEALIVLTDGEVMRWPEPPSVPLLFGMVGDVVAPYGVSVKIKGD